MDLSELAQENWLSTEKVMPSSSTKLPFFRGAQGKGVFFASYRTYIEFLTKIIFLIVTCKSLMLKDFVSTSSPMTCFLSANTACLRSLLSFVYLAYCSFLTTK